MKVTTDACLFGAWVAATISEDQLATGKFLDIGTGSGLLSLMVAQRSNAHIDAIEIDPAAAKQAGENIVASPWKERITIIQDDVLQWQTAGTYNCIFSNPPFYEKELASETTTKNIAHHGEGLRLSDLLLFIEKHLIEDGQFFLLLPSKREKEVETLLGKTNLFLQQKVLVQQTLKHQPFRMMIQGCRKKVEQTDMARLSIKGDNAAYTPAFADLLKDYYLYL